MLRRLGPLLIALLAVTFTVADLAACGDKFLRVGRSSRMRAYASVHPSPILVYAPRWTQKGIGDFEDILKHAGHKPLTVTTHAALVEAFGSRKYEVVITGYPDAAAVQKDLATLPVRPELVPVVYKASKADVSKAAATYRCVIRPEKMTPFEALADIDRVIELRLKDRAAVSR
jgi:hypothetical protein